MSLYRKDKEKYVKEGFFTKVKKTASKVPFVTDAVAMYYCALDSKTPLLAKATILGALAYFILPIDAIPDILPILGFTDDTATIYTALKVVGSNITAEHINKANLFLKGEN
jgi:uncharacterized membrane protein YkvA (DUF1232 family)